MVEVTIKEAEIIRKKLGETVCTTMKQRSSRGKTYAPESKPVLALLCTLRGANYIDVD